MQMNGCHYTRATTPQQWNPLWIMRAGTLHPASCVTVFDSKTYRGRRKSRGPSTPHRSGEGQRQQAVSGGRLGPLTVS